MSLNEKMTAIAAAIREKTGGTDLLSLDAMAAAIPAVYAAGKSAAETACHAAHYAAVVHGSGGISLSFPLPFYPDALIVMAADMRTGSGQVVLYNFLPRSVSYYIGFYARTADNSTNIASFSTLTRERLNQVAYADGIFTLSLNTVDATAAFSADLDYIILASKTETRTDKEILADFVAGLADTGGSVTLSQAAVDAAATDAEWAALLATKPNRTFILK